MINLSKFKKSIEKPTEYILYVDSHKYILETICGTVGMYSIYIELNKEEISDYKLNGNMTISNLAKNIRENIDLQKKRGINTQ